jgi:two-component system, NtrC family, sensor kinase
MTTNQKKSITYGEEIDGLIGSSDTCFRSLVESALDAIIMFDETKTILFANNAASTIFGCPVEDLVGTSSDILMPELVSTEYGAELAGTQESQPIKQVSKTVALTGLRRDGEKIPLECSVSRWTAGAATYYTSIIRDITVRCQAEMQLRKDREAVLKEHEELRRIFSLVEIGKREWEKTMDCIADMVVLTDRQGLIRRCNKTFKEFINLEYGQVLGKNFRDTLTARGIDLADFCSGEQEVLFEPAGRWFRINAYPVQGIEGSQISGSVITLHDTTHTKRMTQKLERSNREIEHAYSVLQLTQAKIIHQEKMASIGQLAAGVAHEINNPMGFIASNLGSLHKYQERIFEYLRIVTDAVQAMNSTAADERIAGARKRLKIDFVLEDVYKLIDESLDGAERVKTIVQNLKSFSHVDQGQLKPANLNDCIDATLNIVWNELKYKATVRKEYGTLPLISCYPQQLNQVFMNLLVNASHAIESQGEIVIKTWEQDQSICASVSDTGCGIPPQNLEKIFEPFFTTKEIGKGTGLGLSIAYDIVKKHKGDLVVQSEVGKGTTFLVRLPLVQE